MPSRLHYRNTPETEVRIEPVGDHSLPQYVVDYPEIDDPEPRAFELLCTAEVKCAVAGNHIDDDELNKRASDLVGELAELIGDMADARGLDDDARQNVVMGNLDGLPEVERLE